MSRKKMVEMPGAQAWLVVCFILVVPITGAHSQFSPGDLSKPHSDLEGTANCTKCHEIGSEISGGKCLGCHKEIDRVIASKHGFHAANSRARCVSCHKEHLGRNAKTVILDRTTFDHSKTGFTLTGKHGVLGCEQCHQSWNIKDENVLSLIEKTGRRTMLGLQDACQSCHTDPHKGTVGTKCEACHSTTAWVPAPSFNHDATSFPLDGRHESVKCSRCHVASQTPSRAFELVAKSFTDCTPCHASPHARGFSEKACRACHTTESWFTVRPTDFDHERTGFALRGKHALAECKQCHSADGRELTSGRRTRRNRCIDCHEDYHRNEFAAKYNNDCSLCHGPAAFSPSTFTIAMHKGTRFDLSGAHAATPCTTCHPNILGARVVFHFSNISCASCHQDQHGGQFTTRMGQESCAHCHTTTTWKLPNFDHSQTLFPLKGIHSTTSCSNCHKPESRGTGKVVQYTGMSSQCESCHSDPHAGQFMNLGVTVCSSCHAPEGWTRLAFDHNTQSAFHLTGAHANVPCAKCHQIEEIAGRSVVRFKPISSKCERCHGEGPVRDG